MQNNSFSFFSEIIPAFSLSESVPLSFHTHTNPFLHTSHSSCVWHYLKAFSHLRFSWLSWDSHRSGLSLPPNTWQSGSRPVPRAAWRLVILRSPSFSLWVEYLQWLFNFLDSYASTWSHLLLTCHPCNSRGFPPGFVYLMTQIHILFANHQINVACEKNISVTIQHWEDDPLRFEIWPYN